MNQRRPSRPSGTVMVCGTTSNAGKSTLAAGLCRHYARRGARVAPFKAQNMSNNSAVTAAGQEVARAQAWQAMAAGVDVEVGMNPVLLKPVGERRCQVVVMGRPVGTMTAAEYHRMKPDLLDVVLGALADLRERYDVVILEGAGSPAEINLLDADIVNLRLAHAAKLPAIVVGDIDLGGVFASLFGTVALLPDAYRALVKGFVVNKLRGDPELLFDATAQLQARCGVPTLGVLPFLGGPEIDSEDSLALDRPLDVAPAGGEQDAGAGATDPDGFPDLLDVAVVRLPLIANFTDLDPLRTEPGVRLRWVDDARDVGQPDLLVIPGSKATVADLTWLRSRGLARSVDGARGVVLGICAGYQMLGRSISDPGGVESARPAVDGLGLLDAVTAFGPDKVTRWRHGRLFGWPVTGYQVHHGVVHASRSPLVDLDDGTGDGTIGVTPAGGTVWGTSLHGLLEPDRARAALLEQVARKAGKHLGHGGSFEAARQRRIDRIADAIGEHLDMDALDRILAEGASE
ncbi:MAG: cobyric acid synthase [Actinomycetota bacterium]|nr:cobyric acid synthase [Actinomycetota bacterium]